MLSRSPKEELKELDKKMVRVGIIDTLGTIALALGLYATFGPDPGNLHPVLEDAMISSGLLVVGGAVAAWGAFQIIAIARRRSEIQNDLNA